MRAGRRRRVIIAGLCGLVIAPALGWGAYAAATWLTFGRHRSAGSDPLMRRHMPRYDIAEVHRTRVAAPASVTYQAARTVDLYESGVVHAIFRARELMLGSTAQARPKRFPLVAELLSIGWGVLEEVPGRQIVFGAVTQPWQSNVVFRALPPSSFASWDSAGFVKIVVTIAADSAWPKESVFRTETRAVATDAESRAKFRRYWSVFSPGILLIRREALSLVRRKAERGASDVTSPAGVPAATHQ
jgi:hypothetical protein